MNIKQYRLSSTLLMAKYSEIITKEFKKTNKYKHYTSKSQYQIIQKGKIE